MDNINILPVLLDSGALKLGRFTLKSGVVSPFFLDLGMIRSGRDLHLIGCAFAAAIRDQAPEATILFGPAYKGIALATATATAAWAKSGTSWNVLFDRKEAKGHGEGGNYIGQIPSPDDQVVIIDDVITNGQTKREAITALESDFGCHAARIIVAVDRRLRGMTDDLPVSALVTIPQLADWLETQGDQRADILRKFWEEGTCPENDSL